MKQDQKDILQLVHSGQFEQALSALQALKSDLGWKDALELRVLRLLKRNSEALKLADSLYSKNKPSKNKRTKLSDEAQRYIALIFAEQGKLSQALTIYSSICDEDSSPELKLEYGTALSGHGDLDAAEEQLSSGCLAQPTNPNFHSQLGRLYCRTGRVRQGVESYQRAAFIEPKKAQHLQRLVYWGNYLDSQTQQANFHLARLWSQKAYPEHQTGSNTWRDANPDKPLKIGFVSGDFCAHAVSFFITPLLKHLNRDEFQVFAYSDVAKPDDITKTIRSHCDVWHDASKQNDDLLAAQMGADQLDVLIDLSGHSANNRLGIFSQHIAPIQVSWLGYPSTTGLTSINYRITDNIADPVTDNKDYFSEELIRLDSCFLCYQPHDEAPAAKTPSANNRQAIRFGSFNNLAKISASTVEAWADILHAVPKSTLYIKRQQLVNDNAKNHLLTEFARHGIDTDRLILKTSKAKIQDHLSEYNQVDIALDTIPYNGTTTTLEALWMGTPVITLRGETHAARVSASILEHIGLPDLVADNKNQLIELATSLANDRKRLASLSKSLRAAVQESSLLAHETFAQQFGDCLREKWKIWCHQRNTEAGLAKEKIMGSSPMTVEENA